MHMRTVFICTLLGLGSLPGLAAGDDFPRTATGKPDFSGNYNIASLTPYTRAEKYGENLTLSVEEAREVEVAAFGRATAGDSSSDPNRPPPEKGASVGSYNYAWFEFGNSMFKIDGKYRTSIITDPPNGRLPTVSEAGTARRAALRPRGFKNTGTAWWVEEGGDPYDDPDGQGLIDRCIYLGVVTVPIRPVVYNNLKTIVQTDDHVLIHIEWMHWSRIVRLDSKHLQPELRSLSGDSIGWWEGDTLVVDTTNFLALPSVPREGLRIVERFSPIDNDSLLYQFTVYDPDYSAPYSGEFPWAKTADKNYEYACHEGNYAMGNTLRGARFLEKEWIETHGASGQ